MWYNERYKSAHVAEKYIGGFDMNEKEIMEKLRAMSRPDRFALLGQLAEIRDILQKIDEPDRRFAIEILHDGLLDRVTIPSLIMCD